MISVRSKDTKSSQLIEVECITEMQFLEEAKKFFLWRKAHLKIKRKSMLLSKQNINRDYLKKVLEYNYIVT